MSIRRKRKPDAYHLNIVREGSGSSKRSRNVRIEKVSIPFSSQVGHNIDSTRDSEDHLSDVSSNLLGCDFQEKAIDGSLNLEGDVAMRSSVYIPRIVVGISDSGCGFQMSMSFCGIEIESIPDASTPT